MSGQPYSDAALHASAKATNSAEALDAAHDRDALGLDASVCARTFLDEIAEKLETLPTEKTRSGDWFARWIRQEYGL